METAAAAMLETRVGRFRGPSMAALLAEMWEPLAMTPTLTAPMVRRRRRDPRRAPPLYIQLLPRTVIRGRETEQMKRKIERRKTATLGLSLI
uniref:Uncharacterized protein n=1 Tax=Oryza nivara TaxID=4536 RepID=A0A0E0HHG2_ORYNI